ncbi:MAG: MATE family efflux transporter, partial [Oscillospiraceae bacterium]|nr:MATE family efflux transporter [Oscillospiraceae bacterium]
MEQLFFTGGRLFAQTFVVTLGTMSITANAVANSVGNFSQVFAQAVSLSAVTIIGQVIGYGDYEQARKYIRQLCHIATAGIIVTLVIMIPLLPVIVGWFNPPEEALMQVYICTLICMLF